MHQLLNAIVPGAICTLVFVAASVGTAEEQATNEGLLAHWPLNEQTWSEEEGEAEDVSGHNHHARVIETTLAEDEQRGWCAQFDGKNDHIVVSEANGWLDVWDSSFTIEAWIKTRDVDQKWQGIAAGSLSLEGLHVYMHQNGLYAFTRIDGTDMQKLSSERVQSDQWYHIAVTRDKQTGQTVLYLDGEPVDEFEAVGQAGRELSPQFMISSERNSFNGYISDVKIWSVARTPEQIHDSVTTTP